MDEYGKFVDKPLFDEYLDGENVRSVFEINRVKSKEYTLTVINGHYELLEQGLKFQIMIFNYLKLLFFRILERMLKYIQDISDLGVLK